MTCCLTAPSHYLNQCFLVARQRHSVEITCEQCNKKWSWTLSVNRCSSRRFRYIKVTTTSPIGANQLKVQPTRTPGWLAILSNNALMVANGESICWKSPCELCMLCAGDPQGFTKSIRAQNSWLPLVFSSLWFSQSVHWKIGKETILSILLYGDRTM